MQMTAVRLYGASDIRLKKLGETNELYRELAKLVKAGGGVWNAEAERYLLEHATKL